MAPPEVLGPGDLVAGLGSHMALFRWAPNHSFLVHGGWSAPTRGTRGIGERAAKIGVEFGLASKGLGPRRFAAKT